MGRSTGRSNVLLKESQEAGLAREQLGADQGKSRGFLTSQVGWSSSAPTRFVLMGSLRAVSQLGKFLPCLWPGLLHTTMWAGGFPSLPDSVPQWYEALAAALIFRRRQHVSTWVWFWEVEWVSAGMLPLPQSLNTTFFLWLNCLKN